MKLTKETLKRIIKEELNKVMNEGEVQDRFGRSYGSFDNNDLQFSQPPQTQRGAEVGREMAAARKAAADLKAAERANKRLHDLVVDRLGNRWKNWKKAETAWNASNKTKLDFQNTIQSELTANAIDRMAEKIKEENRSQDLRAIQNIARAWGNAQVAKYRAEIQDKGPKRSFMQKTGSFLTGKGFKEGLDAAPLMEASGKMIMFMPGANEFHIMLGNNKSITYLYQYAGNEAEGMKQYLANIAGTNVKQGGRLAPKAAQFISQTLASKTNAKISPQELMQMSVQRV